MRRRSHSLSLVLMRMTIVVYSFLFLCPLMTVLSCSRYRSYGEPCIGFQQEVCDTRRLLKCDLRTGTCQCPDFYYYFFDSYYNRCYHKIGTACHESFGGTYENQYEHGCPMNSYCNPGTGYCQCKALFKQNYEGTGCYSSGDRTKGSLGIPIFVLISIRSFLF